MGVSGPTYYKEPTKSECFSQHRHLGKIRIGTGTEGEEGVWKYPVWKFAFLK